ncbi:MAG: NAD(P)-dependent oxidoreductase [Alphaproteobacteria bacterium]|nr:NAD(P)-dependent oxidoreductase [Alphaproteobacteria bacterium]
MRVLVTGAAGFLGGHVARDLARDGFDIIAMRRTAHRAAELWSAPRVEFVAADPARSTRELPSRIDAVLHFAASSPAPGITADALVRDNVALTQSLIGYARAAGAGLFVFASSLSYYGLIEAREVDETAPRRDPDLYGVTKYVGESLLRDCAAILPSLALRLPGVIGRGARRNFLSQTLRRLLAHEPVTAFNPDAPFNNAAYASDLSAFAGRLLRSRLAGFDAATLGARGMTTVAGAIERMRQRAGSRSVVEFRAADRNSFTVSSARAIARYGYDPMEIGDMLDRYVAAELTGTDGPGAEATCADLP